MRCSFTAAIYEQDHAFKQCIHTIASIYKYWNLIIFWNPSSVQKLNCTDPEKEFTSANTPNSYGRRNKLFLRWKVRDRKYYSCKDQSSFPFFESKLMYKVHLKCLTGTRISRKIIMNGKFSIYLYISYSVKLYYMQKRGKIR